MKKILFALISLVSVFSACGYERTFSGTIYLAQASIANRYITTLPAGSYHFLATSLPYTVYITKGSNGADPKTDVVNAWKLVSSGGSYLWPGPIGAFTFTKSQEIYAYTCVFPNPYCIYIWTVPPDITEYKSNDVAVPEEGKGIPNESNAKALVVPPSDAKTAHYVKITLNTGDYTTGTAIFSVAPAAKGDSRKNVVQTYTDPQLTKILKNYSVNLTGTDTNDLAKLRKSNGSDGTVTLYIKTLEQCNDVVAKISINGVTDEAHFKIYSGCKYTPCPAGSARIGLSSVDAQFGLGVDDFGKSAGKICLYAQDITKDTASPAVLQMVTANPDAVTYNSNGPAEINTGTYKVTFDFQNATVNGETFVKSNTMNFIKLPETTPYRTIVITNNYPVKSLKIEDTANNLTSVSEYSQDDSGAMKLVANGIEKNISNIVSSSPETDIDTKTKISSIGPAANPVYQETSIYTIFPWWGERLTQKTVGSESTLYEYYTDINAGNLCGNLKKVTNPKGDTVEYNYYPNGSLKETITTLGGNVYKDISLVYHYINNDGLLCIVSPDDNGEYVYPDGDLQDVGSLTESKRYCNDVLISHGETVLFSDHSLNLPDENSVYDADGNKYTTYTYYIVDVDSLFLGKTRLVKNYNGIVTTYDYSRSSDDITETTVERTGKPDNFNSDSCTVTAGTETITVNGKNGAVLSCITKDIVSQKILSSETAEQFDAFDRVSRTRYLDNSTSEVRYGCCGVEWEKDREGIETINDYDLSGRLKSVTRDGIKTEQTVINGNGETTTQTVYARGGGSTQVTNYVYSNGRMVSSTDPLGRTITYAYSNTADTTTFPDGSTSIANYSQGVQSGTSGTAVHPSTSSSGPLWSKTMPADVTTYTDLLGRQFKTVYADASFGMNYYNSKGQQIKQVTPGGMILLSEYDDLERQSRTAIDINRNGIIDAGDIFTDYQYAYAVRDGKDVTRTTTTVCNDSSTTVITEQSLDGLDSWTTANGRTNHTNVVYPSPRNGSKTVTETRFDGAMVKTTYTNSLVIKIENFNTDGSAGNTFDYAYDGFNRQTSVTEKFGSAVINITETVYDNGNQPVSVSQNGLTTTYVYDNMGRKTQAALPGGRTVYYEYATTGELNKTYGAETYTQALTYTDQGNKASLTTYRSGNNGDTTSWTYNNRNFMTCKTYPDGKSTTYTYDGDGRLLTRLWARGITTSYTYDNAGRQTAITYSDSTPGITFVYDYPNRVTAITDGTGSRAFTYNGDGTLASETIPNIVNSNLVYNYDSFGRRTGMTFNQNSSAVYSNNYTYDLQGQIATVSDDTNTATYTRQPGTNLLTGTTITAGGITKLTTTRTYDNYYQLASISSAAGSVTKAYSYVYDTKDRRTQLNMPDGTSWAYTYDDLGQVKSGIKYDSTGKAIPGQSFGYDYDSIGNLTAEQRGITAMNISYTANSVNQYTKREFPGIAPVVGEADPAAAVKAIRTDIRDPGYADTMIVPVRDGKYFSGMFRNIANTAAAVNVTYDVYAFKNATSQQLINKKSGSYLVAKTPQLFNYDDDGNMLSDGNWTYTYNAENRPIAAVNAANTARLEYAYDYDGRRVSKKVYAKSGENWTLTKEIKFVYDGNNLIAEYDGNSVLLRNYLWGVDLSDGGGTGGLLCVNEGINSYYPVYDGNGNICAYTDNNGALVTEYDYSPFGKATASGTKATGFAFQFSTQYRDEETGTLHYKYRDYNPELIRWTTRDSKEEDGGVNLYAMVNNSPIDNVDYLGMELYSKAPRIVFISLLVGPGLVKNDGSVVGWWDNLIKPLVDEEKVSLKGEAVCFQQLEASPEKNRQAVIQGYGFLFAHGNLYISAQSQAPLAFKPPKDKPIKLDDFKDVQITGGDVKTITQAMGQVINMQKPALMNYQNKLIPAWKIQGGLFLKANLYGHIGETSVGDFVQKAGPSSQYDKILPFYGCYAGVIGQQLSNGVLITSGHPYKKSVYMTEIYTNIKTAVTTRFNKL